LWNEGVGLGALVETVGIYVDWHGLLASSIPSASDRNSLYLFVLPNFLSVQVMPPDRKKL
jgi:hypothetical protein